MTYDPRWTDIARTWLLDSGLSDATAERYTPLLAECLHDTAEDFTTVDLPNLDERRAAEAADTGEN